MLKNKNTLTSFVSF